MKFTWLTDIHLNFLGKQERVHFYQKIIDTKCDAVLISGDIAEATDVDQMLVEMVKQIHRPIYFVLGNHDFYHGDVDSVKETMTNLTRQEPLLNWLPASGPIQLCDGVVLLGQDGWADGRYGDYANSGVVLNDSVLIADLLEARLPGKNQLLEKMQRLADADAAQLKVQVQAAVVDHAPKKIIVATHVPPFRETALYEGKISDDDFLPFFASKATGDVLLEAANHYPAIEFQIFCGHTHSKAEYQPCANLLVQAGYAAYFTPQVQAVIDLSAVSG